MDRYHPLTPSVRAQLVGWPVPASVEMNIDALYFLDPVRKSDGSFADFLISQVNQTAESLSELAREKLLGIKFSELTNRVVSPDDLAILLKVAETQVPFAEERHGHSGDSWKIYRVQFVPAGEGVTISIADMTARLDAKRILIENQIFVEKLASSLPEFVYILDVAETRASYMNRDFLVQLGYPGGISRSSSFALFELVHPSDLPGYVSHRNEAIASPLNEVLTFKCRIRTAKNGWRWFQIRTSAFHRDPDGQPLDLLRTVQDVTEQVETETELREKVKQLRLTQLELNQRQVQLEQLNQQLASLATTDGLTGLYNYRAFHDKLTEEVRRAKRHGHPLSVVLADIDDFKAYNDLHGHPAGDERLRYYSRVVRDGSRESDFVARYGGEEFAMILVNTDVDGAATYAQGIIDRLNIEGGARRITASFGCVQFESKDVKVEDIIRRADECLYAAKRQGKNRYVISEPEIDRVTASS
jgi:diguanylate cyclase (GGDEF)-like protein